MRTTLLLPLILGLGTHVLGESGIADFQAGDGGQADVEDQEQEDGD